MKPSTNRLAIIVIALLLGAGSGCGKPGNTNNLQTSTSPSPAESVQTPLQPQAVEFVEAISRGDVSYHLSGIEKATSSKMNLQVRNETERVWELKIEAGSKLEPGENNVQQMVVTKDVEVHLEPHEEQKLVLDVNCLDINLDTPSLSNTDWTVSTSSKLARFIRCANEGIDSLKQAEPDTASELEKARPARLQHAIWLARGASRDDWIHFLQKYDKESKDSSDEEAGEAVDLYLPSLEKITKDCESLSSL
jgi:hypothetical protein